MKRFFKGKLLLTAEYFVLHGAQSLALPTRLGQHFEFQSKPQQNILNWTSSAPATPNWFQASIQLQPLALLHASEAQKGKRLLAILEALNQLRPNFLATRGGELNTQLDFDPNWGLGSSSTLICFMAEWAAVNPYALLEQTFGGSGYDIACGNASQPLLYRKISSIPEVQPCNFTPTFKEQLYFVYRNKKQSSQAAIHQLKDKKPSKQQLEQMDALTQAVLSAADVKDFQKQLKAHETLVGNFLGQPPLQETHFADFNGTVKSLGAWGGDFFLAVGTAGTPAYFKSKGYSTCFSYNDLIL